MSLPSLPPPSGGGSFDPSRAPTHSLQVSLGGMDVEQLLELRARIDERLPVKDLKDIDLARELVLQLLSTQKLQREVLIDQEIPANQKAQCANSVASTIAQLSRLQGGVYTSERLKRIEGVLIDSVNAMPAEQAVAFLAAYESAGLAAGV